MNKLIVFLVLFSTVANAMEVPLLKLRNSSGEVTKVITEKTLSNTHDFVLRSVSQLKRSCYEGSPTSVRKKILRSENLWDRFADMACEIEARVSSEGRAFKYSCDDGDGDAAKFVIVPCKENL